MPLERCTKNGKRGWRWGPNGTCYIGPGARAKAQRQGRAIKAESETAAIPSGMERQQEDTMLDAYGRISQLQNEEDGDDAAVKYRTMLAPEGVETSDLRFIEEGALTWRTEQPIHVMWSDSESDAHGDAVLVGTFINVHKEEIDGLTWVVADDIDWDIHEDNPAASRAKRLVDEGRLNGVSVHMSEMDADLDCPEDENEPCRLVVHAGQIASGTIVAIPAFEESIIEPVAASGAVDLHAPPREWFDDQHLTELTFTTVTDEGQIFGHMTPAEGACHLGFEQCIQPPHVTGEVDYEEFHSHARVMTQDGGTIPVGVLTFHGGHAGLELTAEEAVKLYDSTSTVGGYVRVGEDEFGTWVAGALAPGLSADEIETIRRLPLSGDWRPRGSKHVLAAAHCVPVPGFSIKARVASGVGTFITVGPRPPKPEESDLALVAAAMQSVADRLHAIELRITRDERRAALEAALSVFEE